MLSSIRGVTVATGGDESVSADVVGGSQRDVGEASSKWGWVVSESNEDAFINGEDAVNTGDVDDFEGDGGVESDSGATVGAANWVAVCDSAKNWKVWVYYEDWRAMTCKANVTSD